MASENKSVAYQIFNSIVQAMSGVEKNIHLLNRPKTVSDKVNRFIVVDVPTSIKPTVLGHDNYQYRSSGLLYCFHRAKPDGTPYIDSMTAWVDSLKKVFPVSDKVCELTHPLEIIRGIDEYGFHLTTISFRIRTKVNAV